MTTKIINVTLPLSKRIDIDALAGDTIQIIFNFPRDLQNTPVNYNVNFPGTASTCVPIVIGRLILTILVVICI